MEIKRLNLLAVIGLIILLSTTGCKDENNEPKIRLSKFTLNLSLYPQSNKSHFFTYTNGLLSGHRVDDKDGTYSEATFLYSGKQLNEISEMDRSWGIQKVDHSYNLTGQLTSATYTPHRGSEDFVLYKTFYYDNKGRINRIDATLDPTISITAFVFEYDEAGNVVKELRHFVNDNGELSYPTSSIKITYDDKKNPYYKLGSPSFLLAYTGTFLTEGHFYYMSVKNPVKIEGYNSLGRYETRVFSYKYNENGYPSELRTLDNGIIVNFDYTIN